FHVPGAAELGRPGPSAQGGAPVMVSSAFRPRAVASRTPASRALHRYAVPAGFWGAAGRFGATDRQKMLIRIMPAPVFRAASRVEVRLTAFADVNRSSEKPSASPRGAAEAGVATAKRTSSESARERERIP